MEKNKNKFKNYFGTSLVCWEMEHWPLKRLKTIVLIYAKYLVCLMMFVWQSTSAQETFRIKKQIEEKIKIVEVSNLPNTGQFTIYYWKAYWLTKSYVSFRVSEKI